MPPVPKPALDAGDRLARFAALRETLARRGLLVDAAAEAPAAAWRPERARAIPTGLAALDALLPGGFPRRAITEIVGAAASGKLSLVAPMLASVTRAGGLAAIVDPARECYPPALAGGGVELTQLLFVRPPSGTADPKPALWSLEVLLQSGAFEAVVLDAEGLPPPPRRLLEGNGPRLRAAAESGGAALVVLAAAPFGLPPALRLEVAASATDGGRARVRVEKSRFGIYGETEVPLAAVE